VILDTTKFIFSTTVTLEITPETWQFEIHHCDDKKYPSKKSSEINQVMLKFMFSFIQIQMQYNCYISFKVRVFFHVTWKMAIEPVLSG